MDFLIYLNTQNWILKILSEVNIQFYDNFEHFVSFVYLFFQITDETEVAKYEEELRLWENERNRQQVEFTLTEKNPNVVTPEMNDIEVRFRSYKKCFFFLASSNLDNFSNFICEARTFQNQSWACVINFSLWDLQHRNSLSHDHSYHYFFTNITATFVL